MNIKKQWPYEKMLLVSSISIIMLMALISIHTPIVPLGFISIIVLLFLVIFKPVMPILIIIVIFTLFPFIAVLWPVIAEAKYTVIKEGIYLIVLAAGFLRHKSGSIQRRISWGSSCLSVYVVTLIFFCGATAPNLMIGLISLRDHIAFILLALVIPHIIRPKDPKRIIVTILILTSLIALIHIIDFGVTHKFTLGHGAPRTLLNALNPNILGTLYATQLAILMCLWWYLIKRSRYKLFMQGLLLSAALILSVALVVTLSRRSIVALALAVLIGFWLLNRSISIRRRILIVIMVFLVGFFVVQHAPETLKVRLHNIIQMDNVDVLRQEELRTFGSEYLSNMSVLLTGRGFGLVGSPNLLRGDYNFYYHNYYIILLSDSGLVGLGLFIFSVGIILLRPLFLRKVNHDTEPLVSAIFQGLLVILISNLFGTTLMSIPVNVFFWCYIGVMIYLLSPYKVKSHRGGA